MEGQKIKDPNPPNLENIYSFKCQECRYARSYGFAELTARTKAGSHARRKSHKVVITIINLPNLTVARETVDPRVGMTPLPLDGSAPF